MQDMSSLLFLETASSIKCFAADRASLMCLIQFAASWFVITWPKYRENVRNPTFQAHSGVYQKKTKTLS